jgi:dCTP diphosphatase
MSSDTSSISAPAALGRPFDSTPASAAVTLEDLRARMAAFVHERDWNRFHQPRNVLLALVGEVGELAEIFQWRGEVPVGLGPSWTAADARHLGEELSDVLLYLLRLSDLCAVDLPAAALSKIEKNAAKYPIHLARGSSDKVR